MLNRVHEEMVLGPKMEEEEKESLYMDRILIERWFLRRTQGGAFDTYFCLDEDRGSFLGPV